MLLLKVKSFEKAPDTEKTFSSMLGLDETEKPPGSKVEMLHLEWKSSFSWLTAFTAGEWLTTHPGSSHHTAFSSLRCQLPKEGGNDFWCRQPHVASVRTDKTRCTISHHGWRQTGLWDSGHNLTEMKSGEAVTSWCTGAVCVLVVPLYLHEPQRKDMATQSNSAAMQDGYKP